MSNHGYKVANGVIVSPGKFEGCAEWAPRFWDYALEGCADDDYEREEGGPLVSCFYIKLEDVRMFPSLAGVVSIELWEDSNGFVHAKVLS